MDTVSYRCTEHRFKLIMWNYYIVLSKEFVIDVGDTIVMFILIVGGLVSFVGIGLVILECSTLEKLRSTSINVAMTVKSMYSTFYK